MTQGMQSGMNLTPSEEAWVERRARKVRAETGWSLPISRSEAVRQLVYNRENNPAAQVYTLPRGRPE